MSSKINRQSKQEYEHFLHLLDDPSFIAYIQLGENGEIWENRTADSPELLKFINETRSLIEELQINEVGLTKEDLAKIWKNLQSEEKNRKQITKRTRRLHLYRFAASLLALFALGTTYWLYSERKDVPEHFQFSADLALSPSGESTLILPSGSQIELQNDDVPLTILADGEIIANNSLISRSHTQAGNQSQRMNQVIVPFGRKTELVLPDGTRVFLNAGSKMAFPAEFSSRQRLVHLEGEAYFDVQHNPTQPFIVIVNELAVKVLGTQFNISGHPEDQTIETVVIEGIVSVSNNVKNRFSKSEVEVTSSMKASWEKGSKNIHLENIPNPSYYSAWTTGLFIFERESLFSVLTKLERYYNVSFKYDRPIQNANISGKLDLKESMSDVLLALADVAGFSFTQEDNQVFIKQKIKQLPTK